jgi:methyltransferase (TIGR00027 family)
MGNPRTENDSWDITNGVGATALGMAAARAHETAKAQPLFSDPYARIFLDEAIRAGGDRPSATPQQLLDGSDPQFEARKRALMDYAASRTAYFDRFFVQANAEEVRQVVVLGAGLDSRPWRLPWIPGTVVYEIDQPQVLEFKINTLWTHNVGPACEYRPVPIDLRSEWPKALKDNGFDPTKSSAWSAEGLLSYLPSAARLSLFDRIHACSAPGSRIAIETASTKTLDPQSIRQRRTMAAAQDADSAAGRSDLREIRALWFADEGDNFADWLARNGWQVDSVEAGDLMARCGRAPAANAEHAVPHSAFVEGIR